MNRRKIFEKQEFHYLQWKLECIGSILIMLSHFKKRNLNRSWKAAALVRKHRYAIIVKFSGWQLFTTSVKKRKSIQEVEYWNRIPKRKNEPNSWLDFIGERCLNMTFFEGILLALLYCTFLAWLTANARAEKMKNERNYFKRKCTKQQQARIKNTPLIEGDEWKKICGYEWSAHTNSDAILPCKGIIARPP